MPTYVKTDYVPEDSEFYLTSGKEYLILEGNDDSGSFVTDNGIMAYVYYKSSFHIDGHAWTVINRP